MQGNSHVRFGERREETGHREVARRFAPTLPDIRRKDHPCDMGGPETGA